MTLTLGIDVAKAKLDVALRLPTGQIRSTIIANTDAGFAELQAWRARHDGIGAHVCMETTGTYWEAVAETLADAGYPVSVVNPSRVKAYGAARPARAARPGRPPRGAGGQAYPGAELAPGGPPQRASRHRGPDRPPG